jgi:hypothetical protein
MYADPCPVQDLELGDHQGDWGRVRHLEPLRVRMHREADGRITVASPELDIAAFGNSELEAWENFLSALQDLRAFYFKNKDTLSAVLRGKLHIFESIYVLQME